MPSLWHYQIRGTDEDGKELSVVDWTSNYSFDLPEPAKKHHTVFLLNEMITHVNDFLGTQGEDGYLPYLDICRVCGEVITDNHMTSITGPQPEGGADGPDTCARCSERY